MSCVSLATPGTEACDAVGGAFRTEWPTARRQELRPGRYAAQPGVVIAITRNGDRLRPEDAH